MSQCPRTWPADFVIFRSDLRKGMDNGILAFLSPISCLQFRSHRSMHPFRRLSSLHPAVMSGRKDRHRLGAAHCIFPRLFGHVFYCHQQRSDLTTRFLNQCFYYQCFKPICWLNKKSAMCNWLLIIVHPAGLFYHHRRYW